MTAKEAESIEKLRDELHAYHVDVKQLTERHESCRQEFQKLYVDFYGMPGQKEISPGLMGDVAELRRGRKTMLWALKGAWVLLTGLIGAAITSVLSK